MFSLKRQLKLKDGIKVYQKELLTVKLPKYSCFFCFFYTVVNHFNTMATPSECKQTHLRMCHTWKYATFKDYEKFVLSYDLAIIQQMI